jgi:uncharacterized protein YkwD
MMQIRHIAIGAVVFLAACSSRGGEIGRAIDPLATETPAGEAARMLAAHNVERARRGVPPLRWSPMLAAYAAIYARDLAQRGAFEHSADASRPGQGENLWEGTAGAWNSEQMIGDFIAERAAFRPGVFPQVAAQGDWSAVGHYTQVIWPTTREVGCAVARRGGLDWLVCRYAPAGNVYGSRVG